MSRIVVRKRRHCLITRNNATTKRASRAGIPAAVWSTMEDTAHSPDEFALVGHLPNDAKMFAHVFMQDRKSK